MRVRVLQAKCWFWEPSIHDVVQYLRSPLVAEVFSTPLLSEVPLSVPCRRATLWPSGGAGPRWARRPGHAPRPPRSGRKPMRWCRSVTSRDRHARLGHKNGRWCWFRLLLLPKCESARRRKGGCSTPLCISVTCLRGHLACALEGNLNLVKLMLHGDRGSSKNNCSMGCRCSRTAVTCSQHGAMFPSLARSRRPCRCRATLQSAAAL